MSGRQKQKGKREGLSLQRMVVSLETGRFVPCIQTGSLQVCQFAENNFYDLVGLYQSSLEVVKSNAINSEINPKYFLEPAVN